MNDTLNIHDYHLGQINSYQRVKIDLKNPTRSMINIIDIATGLGNICRFGGQMKPFYSKHMLGEVYESLESHLTAVIFKKYGLDIDQMPQIKEYDKRAVEMEDDYRSGGNELLYFLFTHYGNPMFWTPEQAVNIYRKQLVKHFNDIIE